MFSDVKIITHLIILNIAASYIFLDGLAPEFIKKLIQQTVNIGASVNMEIQVAGKPTPFITWLQDGDRIETTSAYKFLSGDNKSVLVINKASAEMQGLYTVKISKEFGFAESEASASLHVKECNQLILQSVTNSYKFLLG